MLPLVVKRPETFLRMEEKRDNSVESGLDNISSFTDRPSLPRRVGESTEYVTTIRRW